MGLDMYLSKRTYVGANYEHNKVKGKIELTEGDENTPIVINLKRLSEIIEQVAYWRKANAIHKWFVDNVQDGKDDCNDYYVSREDLQKLIDACKKDIKHFSTLKVRNEIFENVDENELSLKTQGGFFFGNTEYTTYHVKVLKATINMLKPLLKEEGSFYYQSSW